MNTTYIIKENEIENYNTTVLLKSNSVVEAKIRCSILGLEEIDAEKAKEIANVGDCLLFEYDNKLVPFQILDKEIENGKTNCHIQSYYLLEKRSFDKETNVWKDCELRSYLNGSEFANKFTKEFRDSWITDKVHTDDYVTEDKIWIPSHEEIGYDDKNNMFKKNIGAKIYEYYKE